MPMDRIKWDDGMIVCCSQLCMDNDCPNKEKCEVVWITVTRNGV